jgi:hypothetical protein
MPADGFTKSLPTQSHKEFIRMLNLRDIRHIIEATGRAEEDSH